MNNDLNNLRGSSDEQKTEKKGFKGKFFGNSGKFANVESKSFGDPDKTVSSTAAGSAPKQEKQFGRKNESHINHSHESASKKPARDSAPPKSTALDTYDSKASDLTGYTGAAKQPKQEKKKSPANVLSVSLCIVVLLLSLSGVFAIYRRASGLEALTLPQSVGMIALLAVTAAVFMLLVVWGLKWVHNERISELGLHIVRFSVILTAVSLSIFLMLSIDYTRQYNSAVEVELEQHTIAARIAVQSAIGDELGEDPLYYSGLFDRLCGVLDANELNADRSLALYITDTVNDEAIAGSQFERCGTDGQFVAASTEPTAMHNTPDSIITDTLNSGEVITREFTSGDTNYIAAYCPVFTSDGRPVGVAELCEKRLSTASVFNYASLELFLTVAAVIFLFSFAFYGIMQFVDIVLRPIHFDKSRQVLSCGRESARPALFFETLTAAVPLSMLAFSPQMRSLAQIPALPEALAAIVPLTAYIIGLIIGTNISRGHRRKITEMPSNAALIISVLCGAAMMLLLDTKLLPALDFMRQWEYILLLIALSGICYGISYRTISKFQEQSNIKFGIDKYAYLCSCLGALTGFIFGALLLDISGVLGVRIASLSLSAATCALSIGLLEDLNDIESTREQKDNRIVSYGGALLALFPIGLLCCYDWMYITGYLHSKGYDMLPVAACAAAPVVAYCFGNRLRVRTRSARRTVMLIALLIAAGAYVPMIVKPCAPMAVLSCAIVCLSVIFAASALFSILRREERAVCFGIIAPFCFIGIAGAAYTLSLTSSRRGILLMTAAATLICALLFMLSRFPTRPGDKRKASSKPEKAEKPLTAITDGGEQGRKKASPLARKKEEKPSDTSKDSKPEPINNENDKKPASPEKKPDETAAPDKKPEQKEKPIAPESKPVQPESKPESKLEIKSDNAPAQSAGGSSGSFVNPELPRPPKKPSSGSLFEDDDPDDILPIVL